MVHICDYCLSTGQHAVLPKDKGEGSHMSLVRFLHQIVFTIILVLPVCNFQGNSYFAKPPQFSGNSMQLLSTRGKSVSVMY